MKRIILVLALLGSLLLAAGASANGRDANGDRIPDRWEKKHGLSLKVKQTRRDQDKDGLKNRAEWRAQTDPRDDDSDDDGIDDAEEHAGTVTAFKDGVLTITLFDGGTLTGKVTDDTELKCENDGATASSDGDDDEGDDDNGGNRGDDDDEGDDDHGGNRGDEDEDEGDDDDGEGRQGEDEACAPDALKEGATVEEAELKISSAGSTWEEIELR